MGTECALCGEVHPDITDWKEIKMTEKAENPVETKSQKPDAQDKTTVERFNKQSVEVGEDGEETVTKAGDFVKGTIKPNKEG